ncbi:hypothetical protein DVK44_21820 [Streptomyces paludis]|uniref:Uncharacterized protein n=1 Tax=Streptomyces paludis TaxID=2282738 RepID=A0A345I1I6_9ACTN|nr:hypothetical protein DVK44_21820 [Streptomyces paludis]
MGTDAGAGFWGYFLAGRSDRPLAELPALAAVRDELTCHERRPDGWQVWRRTGEPDIGGMGALARAMGSPVVFGFIMGGECVAVEAAAPVSGSWYACLAREPMVQHLAASGLVLEEVFLPAEDAARRAVDWAVEAGATVEPGPLLDVLHLARPEPGADATELFFRLLDGLGVPKGASGDTN